MLLATISIRRIRRCNVLEESNKFNENSVKYRAMRVQRCRYMRIVFHQHISDISLRYAWQRLEYRTYSRYVIGFLSLTRNANESNFDVIYFDAD